MAPSSRTAIWVAKLQLQGFGWLNIALSEITSLESWRQNSLPVVPNANWKMIICRSTCSWCMHTNTNKCVSLQRFQHQNHLGLKLSLVRFPIPSTYTDHLMTIFCLMSLWTVISSGLTDDCTDWQVCSFAIPVYLSFLQGSWNRKKQKSNKEVWKNSQEVSKKIVLLFWVAQKWSWFSALRIIES